MSNRLAASVVVVLAAVAAACAAEPATRAARPGLYVASGTVMRAGRAYRGFGANYFSAFARVLQDPNDRSYRQGFATLREHGIPYVRFMAGGFWPRDWRLYRADKAEYFRRMDEFVAEAERQRIGLIPSLFWYYATVGDLVGEPMDQLGRPGSRTGRFLRAYAAEVVRRYRSSPAVWGWEIGNEYNLVMDLPNASKHRPKVVPALGTAKARTQRDEPTSGQVLAALAGVAGEIRRHDPHRMLISGNSLPRASAWHNTASRSWQLDTQAQFERVLLRDNPRPLDTVCIHLYDAKPARRFADRKVDAAGLLGVCMAAAGRAGRALVVGEFGVPQDGDRPGERRRFASLLAALEAARVPLALFWVFDYGRQEGQWNVTAKGDRAYQLRLIGEANRRLRRADR